LDNVDVGSGNAAEPPLNKDLSDFPSGRTGGRWQAGRRGALKAIVGDSSDRARGIPNSDLVVGETAAEAGAIDGQGLSTTNAAAVGVNAVDRRVHIDVVQGSDVGISHGAHLDGDGLSSGEDGGLNGAGERIPVHSVRVQVAALFVTNVHGEVERTDSLIALREATAVNGHVVGGGQPLRVQIVDERGVVRGISEGAAVAVAILARGGGSKAANRQGECPTARGGVRQTHDTSAVALVRDGVAKSSCCGGADVNIV